LVRRRFGMWSERKGRKTKNEDWVRGDNKWKKEIERKKTIHGKSSEEKTGIGKRVRKGRKK
jgi:hypothetical protein